jgi:hypothetical protein
MQVEGRLTLLSRLAEARGIPLGCMTAFAQARELHRHRNEIGRGMTLLARTGGGARALGVMGIYAAQDRGVHGRRDRAAVRNARDRLPTRFAHTQRVSLEHLPHRLPRDRADVGHPIICASLQP